MKINFPEIDESPSYQNNTEGGDGDNLINCESLNLLQEFNTNIFTVPEDYECEDNAIAATVASVEEENLPFKKDLYNLIIKFRYSLRDRFLNSLLKLLKRHGFSQLPKDVASFLGTPRNGVHYNVVPMKSSHGTEGKYCYLGIEKELEKYISPEFYKLNTIDVIVNIDGLQIYEGKTDTIWPILLKVQTEEYEKAILMVGVYYGDSKPDSAEDYLFDFIEEAEHLIRHGVYINGIQYKFRIIGFTCDIPSRTFLKCIKAHNAFFACERCTVEGESIKIKKTGTKREGCVRTFSNITCTHRTHKSCVAKKQFQHHTPNLTSPLIKIPEFDIIKDMFIEPMHLLDIGVSKRIITTWLSDKKKAIR